MAKNSECVKVVVRCRPMSEKEYSGGYERMVDMHTDRGIVELKNPKTPNEVPKVFTFDSVYDWNSLQRDLYDETFQPLVESVLSGFNGTIFAYGQTGTGKTFTMEGIRDDAEKRGVIPNSFDHIFNHISKSQNQQYLVRASYLEIYQEDIKDLLAKDRTKILELRERPDIGVYVNDLSSFVTKSVKEIEHVMNVGNQNRSVGSTNMNERSSRSHAIFIITVECSEMGLDSKAHIRVGRLNLVDLAGSERQSKTGATGDRFKEATKINLSLSALGNVISALVDGKSSHIPYRDSKLTRLLQDSLGGNAKTVMVANVGPASYNYEETLSTLRYANRAKNIKNKPHINEDPKDALLREFQEEIQRLKAALASRTVGGTKNRRRRKKAGGENGENIDEEREADEDSATNLDDEYVKRQQVQIEQEKHAILANKTIIGEEKAKLLKEIEQRAAQLKNENDARHALATRISAMESKLLSGGGSNIVFHTREQEAILAQKRQELAEQRLKEREMLDMLESQEGSAVEIQQTFSSLQQEVEIKTKKLKKLFSKLQQVKTDIFDSQNEHSRQRQELEDATSELTKELKLKALIVENFVPADIKDRLLERAMFDENEDSWTLKPLSSGHLLRPLTKRPVSVTGAIRPQCYHGTDVSHKSKFFPQRGENILLCSLDITPRAILDYTPPKIPPGLQAAIDKALNDDNLSEDMLIDASAFKTKSISRPKSTVRPTIRSDQSNFPVAQPTGKKMAPSTKAEVYPKARGLVTK